MSKPSKITENHTKNGSSKRAKTSQGSSGENKNAQSFQVPEAPNVTNSSDRDSCSKTVFQDPVLLAQFIRDYSEIPLLKNVRPEDIQNVTNRFVHLFSEDRNSDSINRIQIDGYTPFFVVSLIEHKTYVDYNVTMQILRYMVYIWEDYEKEVKRLHDEWEKTHHTGKNPYRLSFQKDFTYPVIIPVVYYEGSRTWKAPLQLRERICMSEEFASYIPDFSYDLVQLKDYTNEFLLSHADEISLIMMFNKLQNADDISKIQQIPPEQINEIISETPEYLLDIMAQVIRAFLLHINLPIEETDDIVGNIKERKMGYFFEHAEKMDIQEERRLRKEAEERLATREFALTNALTEKDNTIVERENTIAEQKDTIAEQENTIAELMKKLAVYENNQPVK